MRRQTDIFLEIDSLLGSCIVSDPVIIDQNNLEYLDHDVWSQVSRESWSPWSREP